MKQKYSDVVGGGGMVIFILIILIFILVGCSGVDNSDVVGNSGAGDNQIFVVIVEGMPCVVADGYQAVSITCNWDMWKGSGR